MKGKNLLLEEQILSFNSYLIAKRGKNEYERVAPLDKGTQLP